MNLRVGMHALQLSLYSTPLPPFIWNTSKACHCLEERSCLRQVDHHQQSLVNSHHSQCKGVSVVIGQNSLSLGRVTAVR